MKTFEESFCVKYACDPSQFRNAVFRRCLHRQAIPLVPLLGGFKGTYFAPERELIASVEQSVDVNQVREEIRAYRADPMTRRWLRKSPGIRISTRRLKSLAKELLPDSGSRRAPLEVLAEAM